MRENQLADTRAALVVKSISSAAHKWNMQPVHRQTALRIGTDVLINGGSVSQAIDAANRYIAARVVREKLVEMEKPQKREPVSEWVGWVVFGAAIIVICIEAAKAAGVLA